MLQKTLIVAILLLQSTFLLAQDIIYEPVFIDQCNGLPNKDVIWFVYDSTTIFGQVEIFKDRVTLPKKGVYRLDLILEPIISILVDHS